MPPIEPPEIDIPTSSGSKSNLVSWIIGVLVVAIGALFGYLINAQQSVRESKDKEIERLREDLKASRQETADARRELKDCYEENRAIIGGYSLRPGRKTMIITPSEGQNTNYENSN